jgi:hypothetical protein
MEKKISNFFFFGKWREKKLKNLLILFAQHILFQLGGKERLIIVFGQS